MEGRNPIAILGLRSITSNFPIQSLYKTSDIRVNSALTYTIQTYIVDPDRCFGSPLDYRQLSRTESMAILRWTLLHYIGLYERNPTAILGLRSIIANFPVQTYKTAILEWILRSYTLYWHVRKELERHFESPVNYRQLPHTDPTQKWRYQGEPYAHIHCIGMYGRNPSAILGPRSISSNFPIQSLYKAGDIRASLTLTYTV